MSSLKILFVLFFICLFCCYAQTNFFNYYNNLVPNSNGLSEQSKIIESSNVKELLSLDFVISRTITLFSKENSVLKDSAFVAFWNYYLTVKDNFCNQITQTGLPINYSAFTNISDYPSKASEKILKKSGYKFNETELKFLKDLNQYSLKLTSREGMYEVSFGNKRIIEDYFKSFISNDLYLFIEKTMDESIVPYAYDGAISIPLTDAAKRLVVWENISNSALPIYFIKQANDNYKNYLNALIAGIDNTPAFNPSTNRLNKKFETVYKGIIKNYKGTESAAKIKLYLELLKKNKFIKTQEIEIFINNL
ncbi:MAG: hypothetical protein V1773_14555 [bacterium]